MKRDVDIDSLSVIRTTVALLRTSGGMALPCCYGTVRVTFPVRTIVARIATTIIFQGFLQVVLSIFRIPSDGKSQFRCLNQHENSWKWDTYRNRLTIHNYYSRDLCHKLDLHYHCKEPLSRSDDTPAPQSQTGSSSILPHRCASCWLMYRVVRLDEGCSQAAKFLVSNSLTVKSR